MNLATVSVEADSERGEDGRTVAGRAAFERLADMLEAGAQAASEAKKKQKEAYEGDDSEEEPPDGPGVACHPQ